MSLSLGRASSFNDWDIDVKMFQISKDPAIRPWGMGAVIFIELARIQGQMYEQLYSISASSQSSTERLKVIDVLSRSLDHQYKVFRSVSRPPINQGKADTHRRWILVKLPTLKCTTCSMKLLT